ncbi:MAG: hypothetical protein MI924_25520 [Chloroflexales bacterium]|nr:hypothetical protein [Chloroflexales bacterium]
MLWCYAICRSIDPSNLGNLATAMSQLGVMPSVVASTLPTLRLYASLQRATARRDRAGHNEAPESID